MSTYDGNFYDNANHCSIILKGVNEYKPTNFRITKKMHNP